MKKLLFFLTVVVMTSCATKTTYLLASTSIDYSGYSKGGFFITESESVGFDYEPIGHIIVYARSGYEQTDYGSFVTYSKEPKIIRMYDALNELMVQAMKLEGNGIIGLKITCSSTSLKKSAWDGSTMETGMEVVIEGMAIKRVRK